MHAMLEQEVQEAAFSNASAFTRQEFLAYSRRIAGISRKVVFPPTLHDTLMGVDGDYGDRIADRM